MNRRELLQQMLIGGAAAMVSPLSLAQISNGIGALAGGLPAKPWTLGFQSVEQDSLSSDALSLSGRWPAALQGTFYRNMPARFDRGGQRYQHWFDGDGMVQAFRLSEGRIAHQGRFVETHKFLVDEAAGSLRTPTFGTRFAGMDAVISPDNMNVANISVVWHGDRLFALWEAGSAWELDPQTLATIGPVTWRDDLQGVPFSAHPRKDSDGSLWNFGAAGGQTLVIYHIGADGVLKKAEGISVPGLPMMHDFAITERHLVFLLAPMILQMDRVGAGHTVLDSYQWQSGEPMRVLTVDKNDWSKQRWYELPSGFVFHLGNAWEEPGGMIRFDYLRYADARVLTENFRAVMTGEDVTLHRAQLAQVRLSPENGRAEQQLLPGNCEFPGLDPRAVGVRQRYLVLTEATGDISHPGFNALRRIDLDRETEQSYRFEAGTLVEEHLVIPKSPSAPDGDAWLLGTVLDTKKGVTGLTLFDAAHIADGPIAQAALPYGLPLGFHSHFVSNS
ncbi:MAG: carotenoid oxygenase family protein [Pseudomonas sp.]